MKLAFSWLSSETRSRAFCSSAVRSSTRRSSERLEACRAERSWMICSVTAWSRSARLIRLQIDQGLSQQDAVPPGSFLLLMRKRPLDTLRADQALLDQVFPHAGNKHFGCQAFLIGHLMPSKPILRSPL